MSAYPPPNGGYGEVAHQLGQIAATLDEVHAAVMPGDGTVVLATHDVAFLRQALAREGDESLPDQVRHDARIQLCGYLDAALRAGGAR